MGTKYQPDYLTTYAGSDSSASLEFAALQDALARSVTQVYMDVMYASPPKVQPGMVVSADGTSWNPGSGEGVYRRSLAGTWVLIG